MEINTTEILQKSRESLLLLAEQINAIKIEAFQDFVITSNQFRTLALFNETITNISKTEFPIIYMIELENNEDRKQLIKTFETFSKTNKTNTKNVDRINHSKYNNGNSKTLYVGSSTNDFKTRLKDHLGVKKSCRTYALHLSKWDKNLVYSIRVRTYKISKTNRNIVELIEQQIWDQLKPVFGKRSGLL